MILIFDSDLSDLFINLMNNSCKYELSIKYNKAKWYALWNNG